MFKCSVKIDEKLQKEINNKMWTSCLIATIVGAIGLGVYVLVSTFHEHYILEWFMWCMAFVFAFGLVYLIMVNRINKKTAQKGMVDVLEIYEDYITIQSIQNNETIATMKVYFKDIIKIRETENYLVLYINKASAIPVPKNSFSAEEFSTIKLWVYSAKEKKSN